MTTTTTMTTTPRAADAEHSVLRERESRKTTINSYASIGRDIAERKGRERENERGEEMTTTTVSAAATTMTPPPTPNKR